jgi:hypothetical protein
VDLPVPMNPVRQTSVRVRVSLIMEQNTDSGLM